MLCSTPAHHVGTPSSVYSTRLDSDTFCMKVGDEYFHMVRLIEHRIERWRSFTIDQQQLATSYSGADLSRTLADKGFKAFLSVLEYATCADVWVAYAADQPMVELDETNHSSVEMFVSIITSRGARFTGHMGIGRAMSYRGTRHPALSTRLHGFAARVTLMVEPSKSLMLTVPASRMREILLKALSENAGIQAAQIGDGTRKIALKGMEIDPQAATLAELMERQRELIACGADSDLARLEEFERNELAIALRQQIDSQKHTDRLPLVRATKSDDGKSYRSFDLEDGHGNSVQRIKHHEMSQEYAWFFQSNYFVANTRQPLLAVRLDALASLSDSHCIEILA